MNEPSKHAIWILGVIGSFTLGEWNTIVGIACGAAGFVYACLGIYSWVEKRRRKAREAAAEGGGLKIEDRKGRRRDHRTIYLFLLILLLMVGIALVATAQPTNEIAANASSPLRNAWAALVAEDARKLIYDFLSGFSLAAVAQWAFLAYLSAKGLRNYTPLGKSAGWIGALLRLINLEAKMAANATISEQTNNTNKT